MMNIDEAMIKRIAREVAEEMVGARRHKAKESYKRTVEALESIVDLKDKIAQDELDIADMEMEKKNISAWHGVKRPGGPALDDNTRHLQKIRNRERGMIRTQRLLNRILSAMDKLKREDGYEILQLKYIDGLSDEEIAKTLNYTVRSIQRKRCKLVGRINRKLLGADAMDL
jgi:DNA-directed RNA polymerase specialized sigma24 family protein